MNKCSAKVSLIVPVYNVKEYLGKCLDSCKQQTLSDLEIICVDDGSTDGSGEILDVFAKSDYRVSVIHKENGGLSSARNAGLNAAQGAWIMFLDSDDYLEPNACERVWIESQEGQTDIIVFGSKFFPRYKPIENEHWLNSVLNVRTERFNAFHPDVLLRTAGAKPFVWRQAYSHELIKKYCLHFDETARFAEDIIFQFMSFPNASNFAFISDELYNYRVNRPGSLMSSVVDSERIMWHICVVDKVLDYWRSNGFLSMYGTEILSWVIEYALEPIMRVPEDGRVVLKEKLKDVLQHYGMDVYGKELPSVDKNLYHSLIKMD